MYRPMYRIGMVCEGPADRAILEAVLDSYFDDDDGDYVSIAVQPPTGLIGGAAGPFGGGWKGVRHWCTSEVRAHEVGWAALLGNVDLLILQVDADVASEPTINRAKPCPPPTGSADEVRALVLEWLGFQVLPTQVVLCVPSMASETWALVALLPQHAANVPCDPAPIAGQCMECRTDSKAILSARSRDVGAKLVTLTGRPAACWSQRGGLPPSCWVIPVILWSGEWARSLA